MNPVIVHMMLNHFPVVATVCGFLVLAGGYFLNSPIIKRTGLVLFVFAAIMSIPVYFSGDGAKEVLENSFEVPPTVIRDHRDVAQIYFIAMLTLGVMSVVTLALDLSIGKYTRSAYYFIFIMALIVMAISYRVASLGGEIRHPEL